MILLRSHLWSGSEDTVTLSPPFLLWRGEVGHGNGQQYRDFMRHSIITIYY